MSNCHGLAVVWLGEFNNNRPDWSRGRQFDLSNKQYGTDCWLLACWFYSSRGLVRDLSASLQPPWAYSEKLRLFVHLAYQRRYYILNIRYCRNFLWQRNKNGIVCNDADALLPCVYSTASNIMCLRRQTWMCLRDMLQQIHIDIRAETSKLLCFIEPK